MPRDATRGRNLLCFRTTAYFFLLITLAGIVPDTEYRLEQGDESSDKQHGTE